MKKSLRRTLCAMLAIVLFAGLFMGAAEAPDGANWTSTVTADGWILVENEGGASLGYSPDSGVEILTVDGLAFKDLNKNGELDIYEDWRLTDEERAADLVADLTHEEIYPLMLYSLHFREVSGDLDSVMNILGSASASDLLDLGLRAFLNADTSSEASAHVDFINAMQTYAETNGNHGIPIDICSDPRSNASANDSFYDGSKSAVSKWPGNLGMAATFDPSIVEQHGRITGAEYRALGISTALSPQIDLGTEPRWARFNGTYGESSQLAADMSEAYVLGFQSTQDENGDDVWGSESVAVMLKHWPGDGSGEAGRESHAKVGKYAVYPGDNMDEAMSVFDSALIDVEGTQLAASIMPSYSIAIGSDGESIGEGVGSGLSEYKMQDLLRDERGFEGIICTDWGVGGMYTQMPDGTIEGGGGMVWGAEDMDPVERVWMGIANGLDMWGGLEAPIFLEQAHTYAVEELGVSEEDADSIFRTAATRILTSWLRLGLFENGYVSGEETAATLSMQSSGDAGYEAQQKSIVMLKNEGDVIAAGDGEKKTVYIPMQDAETLMFEEAAANEYFNVVTDTVDGEEITRLTDFTDVDFALVRLNSPGSTGSFFNGYGIDVNTRNVPGDEEEYSTFGEVVQQAYREDEPIDNGYVPMTLQYREYTADPAVVREYPLGTDDAEEEAWIAAGGEAGKSRYYGGKTVTATNEAALDLVLEVAQNAGDVPVIVCVAMSNPMCFYEFEPEVEGIVVSFSASDRAVFDIVTGAVEPSGLLPMQMPIDMNTVETQLEDVAFDMECHVDSAGNTYDFAFGLNWSGQIADERTEKYAK